MTGSAVAIGPLMLAVDRGLAVLCIVVFFGLTALAERLRFPRLGTVATSAIVAGMVAARIGYVVPHWRYYAEAPLSTLAVWQGGFSAVAGLVGAAAMLAIRDGLALNVLMLFWPSPAVRAWQAGGPLGGG